MFGTLDRYLLRQVMATATPWMILFAVLLVLETTTRVLDYLLAGAPLGLWLELMLAGLPRLIVPAIIVATFAGIAEAYGRLNTDRELTAAAAAGFGPLRLLRPAVAVGLIGVLAAALVEFWLGPAADQRFRQVRDEARAAHLGAALTPGSFNRLGEAMTVYVRERGRDGSLIGLTIHDARDPARPETFIAAKGFLVDEGGRRRLVLYEGERQVVDPERGNIPRLSFAQIVVDLNQGRQMAAVQRLASADGNPGTAPAPASPAVPTAAQAATPQPATPKPEGLTVAAEIAARAAVPLVPLLVALIVGAASVAASRARDTKLARAMLVAGIAALLATVAAYGLGNAARANPALLLPLYGVVGGVIAGALAIAGGRLRLKAMFSASTSTAKAMAK